MKRSKGYSLFVPVAGLMVVTRHLQQNIRTAEPISFGVADSGRRKPTPRIQSVSPSAFKGELLQPRTASWKHEGAARLWLSRDGSTLVSQVGDQDGEVDLKHSLRVWDVVHQKFVKDIAHGKERTADVLALADDGRHLLVGHSPCELYDLASSAPPWTLKPAVAPSQVLAAAFLGKTLLVLWPDCVETRNLKGRVLKRVALKFKRKKVEEHSLGALSSDGHSGALWSLGDPSSLNGGWLNSKRVIFDARTGRVKHIVAVKLPGEGGEFENSELKFSPDNQTLMATATGYVEMGMNEDAVPLIVTDHWFWNVSTGKGLWLWENVGSYGNNTQLYHAPFSPDGQSILYYQRVYEEDVARGKHGRLEFRNLTTHRTAQFQILRPWGAKDERYTYEVQLSGDGKVRVALDEKGNIWVQTVPRQSKSSGREAGPSSVRRGSVRPHNGTGRVT